MNALIQLDATDLILSLGLIALTIALAVWQQLGLAWNITIATGRTILQLTIVGYLLDFVFQVNNPWIVLIVLVAMVTIAAVVARNRINLRSANLLPLVWAAILSSSTVTLAYTTLLIVRPSVWYEPQYVIPLAGIILGNAMNGAALAGERLVSILKTSQVEVETHLSLGATPAQAVASYQREAIKAGVMPTLNTMMVVGVVTLPGIITGQMLSGVKPLDAAAYQMVIMFMLAFVTLLTTFLVTTGIRQQVFSRAAQFTLK